MVLVDTAGRLHNKQNLMNELNKIRRVIDREGESSSKEVLLVLDATTGQNGLIQAKQFSQSAGTVSYTHLPADPLPLHGDTIEDIGGLHGLPAVGNEQKLGL